MVMPAPLVKRLRETASRTLCLFVLLAFSAPVACAAEVIERFDSVVSVARDGTLTVTETIRVNAEGKQIKRGIYRDFPLTFRDDGGQRREVSFDLLDVMRDGKPEPFFTRSQGPGIRIYAGKSDVFIPRGKHTYVFRYRTGRQVRWFDGKAELNWNVTGNFWNFPIEAARYRLHLADGLRLLRFTAYTGERGARGTDWRGEIGNANELVVETTKPLPPGHGLTVVAALPDGAVEPPTPTDEFWYAVLDNRHWIFAGTGFVLLLGYYLATWNAVGRDPKGGVIIPLFHPPNKLSPALANYVHNWGFGRNKWRAFTAAALSLAVRGLLLFDDKDEKLTLKTTGREPKDGDLPPGELAIFDWVKQRGGSVSIDSANGSAVSSIGASFTAAIEQENRHRFFKRNIGYVIFGLVLTVAAVVGTLVFGHLSDEDIGILILIVMAGVFGGAVLVPVLLALFKAASFASVVRSVLTVVMLGIFVTVAINVIGAVFPGGFGEILPTLWFLVSGYPFPFLLVGAFAILNGFFLYLMRAPTALGRPIMDRLAGFRLYLETAESARLNLQAPEITTERFEALLPYAVALNVEKPWSEAFAAALKRAHPAEADPMHSYHPAWRTGSGWSGGNFSNAVSSSVAGMSGAFASAVPASSGSSGFSSGGGGSGGGGGGGGGGGW